MDEEELSELQLRLLALQSASKKWQQKEQQVMKKSKDRITKPVQEKSSVAAAAPGRQRVTTRSASSAAAAAAAAAVDRSRTRSKPGDRDRDRTNRERPRPAPRALAERGRTPGKAHVAKKTSSPGE